MTEEEINIAIATACGKKYHKPTEEEIARGSYYQYQPNYFRSLDAMHEAEKVLTTEKQRDNYRDHLSDIVSGHSEYREDGVTRVWHATAAQRAEAFLKCLNLWKK